MRFPNGYGSIIKLSGKRRKPYAVRITVESVLVEDHVVQKYKYLEYFEKRTDAMLYLSNYNAGMRVREHQSLAEAPTFEDVYRDWYAEKERRTGISDNLRASYKAAFAKYKPLHKKKIRNIRLADVQPILDAHSNMSKSTIANMMTVIHGIYHYAMRYEYVENDFTNLLMASGQAIKPIHTNFTEDEIKRLWELSDDPIAQYTLVLIYTGMRPIEATLIRPEDVHMDERYMVGGVKTKAGRNRVIPIHRKIMPIIEARLSGPALFEPVYSKIYKKWMAEHGFEHLPHDGRHTCATLLEYANVPLNRRKLILGHKIDDITEGTYTHLTPADLVAEIDKIEV